MPPVQLGCTALIPSGPPSDPGRNHLFVYVTKPFEDEKGALSVAVVPLCTAKRGQPMDPTCILQAGEHPFIKHETYVYYEMAAIKTCEAIMRGIDGGAIRPAGAMPGAPLKKIMAGMCRSPKTPQRVKDFFLFAS